MKIGIIIPDRGDRPEFLKNCLRMIDNQQFAQYWKKDGIEIETFIVDYKPKNSDCDITPRYKKGYEYFSNQNVDIVFLIENDDWYSKYYMNTMLLEWVKNDKPDILGTNYTIYYNIGICKHKTLEHFHRSSAMSTILKPNLKIQWPKDEDPYTDIHLWKQLNGVTFRPKNHICLGIKHGVGKPGGHYHINQLDKYPNNDDGLKFLQETIDSESFVFYKGIHEKIKDNFK